MNYLLEDEREREADMNNQELKPELKYVTRRRAAVLLGMSENELRQISSDSGFGHTERAGDQEETFFTYAELRQICQLVLQPVH